MKSQELEQYTYRLGHKLYYWIQVEMRIISSKDKTLRFYSYEEQLSKIQYFEGVLGLLKSTNGAKIL